MFGINNGGKSEMNRLQAIKRSTLDIIYFGLGAKILSFIKGMLIAYQIGANHRTDTYIVAFSATMLLTKIIADGLTISMVPILQQIDKKDGKKGRIDFTNNMFSLFVLLSFILIFLGYVLAPLIIKILGPGFKGEELVKTISLFRLGLPIMTFQFIRAICGGYLQAEHKFKSGAKSGVINNLIYIIYLLLFAKRFGLVGLMIVGIFAVAGQVVVMMKAMIKGGYKYRFEFNLKDRLLKRILSFLLLITISISINEMNAAIDKSIASILEPGTIAELNYANDIITLVLSLFISALVTAIFPVLSESFNNKDEEDFKETVNFSLNLLLVVVVPIGAILFIFAEPIIKVFYERGAFSSESTYLTALNLRYYAIGFTGMGLVLLLTRIYYAINVTQGAMTMGVITLISNFVLNVVLSAYMGGKGIALATTISVVLAALYGLYDLNQRIGFVRKNKFIIKVFKLQYESKGTGF